jgi:hypothetical protein
MRRRPPPSRGAPRRWRRPHFDTRPTPATARLSTVRHGHSAIPAPVMYRVAALAGLNSTPLPGFENFTPRQHDYRWTERSWW